MHQRPAHQTPHAVSKQGHGDGNGAISNHGAHGLDRRVTPEIQAPAQAARPRPRWCLRSRTRPPTNEHPDLKRIHPTVLLMASAHFMVDGYGNIYAPLLPLLIPKLHLSLAAAGTLTMLYQMAASVAQVGFGHIADRLAPPAAGDGRPRRRGDDPQFRRRRAERRGARGAADRRRPRRRGVSSPRRRARAPPRWQSSRPGDVGAHHRRDARVLDGPAAVRAGGAAPGTRIGRRCSPSRD